MPPPGLSTARARSSIPLPMRSPAAPQGIGPACRAARATSLLDDWASLAHERNANGTAFGYRAEPGISKTLLHEVLEPRLDLADARERRVRVPRSLRDVEQTVLLRKVAPNGAEIDGADA